MSHVTIITATQCQVLCGLSFKAAFQLSDLKLSLSKKCHFPEKFPVYPIILNRIVVVEKKYKNGNDVTELLCIIPETKKFLYNILAETLNFKRKRQQSKANLI